MIFRHLLNMRSHPTWVRGLKLGLSLLRKYLMGVAPYVGAWIETKVSLMNDVNGAVAPYVGAWIETIGCSKRCRSVFSRTLRGCVD